jgi:NTP pyrophosphatase (non-canonical NTP hydrolase)
MAGRRNRAGGRGPADLFPGPMNAEPPASLRPRIAPLRPTEVYDTYWRFAAERQRVFFKRLEGHPPPWTEDEVLRAFKFTNAYRASDRVSQYMIRNVIYRDDLPDLRDEVFFRILLFKVFNRIETWELLEKELGQVVWEGFSFKRYDRILTGAMARGQRIYSAAYIMPSAGSLGYEKKHRNHLALVERMMADELPRRLADAPSMQRGFELLRDYPSVGDFLAYQFITDVNYSTITHFTEMDFVVPGPGALDGIRKCFADCGGLNGPEVIRFMADRQEMEFERLGLEFRSLWGRRLQLIDCQNLFCEVDKYARERHPQVNGLSGRKRIKQKFQANPLPIRYWYPPKWGINDQIEAHYAAAVNGRASGTTNGAVSMSFHTYQEAASRTDRNPSADGNGLVIPLLGLAGEAGELLSEYKKFLRDGDAHTLFKDRFAEELGDILWYLANLATKFGLRLDQVAEQNLAKCQDRWGNREASSGDAAASFDVTYPETERLPRQITVDITTIHVDGKPRMKAFINGEQIGDDLTDNAYDPDGYRYHDVFHLAFAGVLGWSPIIRSILKRKRKSSSEVDEVEDGGRAKAIEEGVSALIFRYAKDHNWLEGTQGVSCELLRTIKSMTTHLEVSRCSSREWEEAIIKGLEVWRQIKKRGGGTLLIDLDQRTITIKEM